MAIPQNTSIFIKNSRTFIQIETFSFQVTRLLANHRRRLQLQKKRRPAGDEKDDAASTGDKENRLSPPSKTVIDHVNLVIDEVLTTASRLSAEPLGHGDEETRMVSEGVFDLDRWIEKMEENFFCWLKFVFLDLTGFA
jgi:hypothetical protein